MTPRNEPPGTDNTASTFVRPPLMQPTVGQVPPEVADWSGWLNELQTWFSRQECDGYTRDMDAQRFLGQEPFGPAVIGAARTLEAALTEGVARAPVGRKATMPPESGRVSVARGMSARWT
jgi:hypothetical protein